LTDRIINLDFYEVVQGNKDINVLSWAEKIQDRNDETLTFTTYDGCGNPIYSYEFVGIKILSHTCSFDYACSDEVTSHLIVPYENKSLGNMDATKRMVGKNGDYQRKGRIVISYAKI